MRLVLCLALAVACCGCGGADAPADRGLTFRAQCAASDPGAVAVTVQSHRAWFGPPRHFALQGAFAVTDQQSHPAISLMLAPAEHAQFEAFTTISVAGPLGIFLDGELVASPAVQAIGNGRFTFCNEAGGWTAQERDLWLQRIRAAEL